MNSPNYFNGATDLDLIRSSQFLFEHHYSPQEVRDLYYDLDNRARKALAVDGLNGESWQTVITPAQRQLLLYLGFDNRTNLGIIRYVNKSQAALHSCN